MLEILEKIVCSVPLLVRSNAQAGQEEFVSDHGVWPRLPLLNLPPSNEHYNPTRLGSGVTLEHFVTSASHGKGPETASLQDQIRINTCHIILRLLCTECPSQIPPQALALARCMVVEVAEARADNPHGEARRQNQV